MAPLKKYTIFSIFISLFAILFMSHNVSATETVINLDNYTNIYSQLRANVDCSWTDGSTSGNQSFCTNTTTNGNIGLVGILSNNTTTVQRNDIIEFDLIVIYPESSYPYTDGFTFLNQQNNNFRLLSVKENYNTTLPYSLIFDGSTSYSGNYLNISYHIIAKSLVNDTIHIGLLSNSVTFPIFRYYNDSSNRISFKIVNTNIWRANQESNSVDQQNEISETNNAVDNSESAGDSSSQDAEQGGASLLSAITGFFGVITSASPTNCVFNAPLNTHFGNQRLNVDLCSLTLPPQIGALTSIIAIGIIIPFAIHMFKKFIGLFRSFQS